MQSLIDGHRRFRTETLPGLRDRYERLVADGQQPATLFIGCADSRVLPNVITDTGPGELFVIRNVGALVPPHGPGGAYHAAGAGIEYAVLNLGVTDIVVCGHSHCGAIRALYGRPGQEMPHLTRWLQLARDARVGDDPTEANLRKAEQRSIALQLDRLRTYPFVASRVDAGALALHGWHYVIEDGQVLALDAEREEFVAVG